MLSPANCWEENDTVTKLQTAWMLYWYKYASVSSHP